MRLIDADKLKDAFYNRKRTPDDMKYLRVPAELVYQFIENAPTVIWCSQTSEGLPLMDLRERPKGEWKVFEYCGETCYMHKCSNEIFKANYHFCPNCGADMRKAVRNEC